MRCGRRAGPRLAVGRKAAWWYAAIVAFESARVWPIVDRHSAATCVLAASSAALHCTSRRKLTGSPSASASRRGSTAPDASKKRGKRKPTAGCALAPSALARASSAPRRRARPGLQGRSASMIFMGRDGSRCGPGVRSPCDTARPMPAPRAPSSALAIALAGLVSLAVAMGIGRFAFTPLLPMMLAERTVTLAGASLLASANYFGYLVGALVCTFQPWLWRRAGWASGVNGPGLVRAGLVATALLTLGMAVHAPALWSVLRFAAGVASAVVFLYTSGWCLEQLARRGVPATGALIYVGPGLGIVASGLAASGLGAIGSTAAVGWITFGAIAALLTAGVWGVFDGARTVEAAPAVAAAHAAEVP